MTRRGGKVGTNLSFCAPRRVTSLCLFARLAMALPVVGPVNGAAADPDPEPDPEPEPDGVEPLAGGWCWSDIGAVLSHTRWEECKKAESVTSRPRGCVQNRNRARSGSITGRV